VQFFTTRALQLGRATYSAIAEPLAQLGHRFGKLPGRGTLSQPQLPRPLLEVAHAHTDEAHGPPAVCRPRALEEARSKPVDVVRKIDSLRDSD
jgi:hypothetical protein